MQEKMFDTSGPENFCIRESGPEIFSIRESGPESFASENLDQKGFASENLDQKNLVKVAAEKLLNDLHENMRNVICHYVRHPWTTRQIIFKKLLEKTVFLCKERLSVH